MSNAAKDFPMRGPMMIGAVSLFVLIGGFGFWSATAEISGAVIASGQIEVDQNRQVVQHPDGGVVAEILVDDGDLVAEGDALVKLDPTLLQSELTITEDQYYEIIARRARLEAERDGEVDIVFDPALLEVAETHPEIADLVQGQRALYVAQRASEVQEINQLLKRAEQTLDQVRGIEAQQVALTRQVELIDKELVDQQSLLDKGLAQASRVLSLQREAARLSGRVGELTAAKAQAEGRITEVEIQVLRIESQRRQDAISELRDVQFRERELAEKRRALQERLSRLEITAPVSGVVYGMNVFSKRSVIRPADPVLFLVPQDRPLVIAAQVPPVHVDQVFVGQDVSLRFSALDQRQTPELFGHVQKISADALTDQNTGISYYEAEIVLNEGEIDRLPPNSTLIPGMPVDAFIRTDDRTPIAYLVKPFADYFSKAFRES